MLQFIIFAIIYSIMMFIWTFVYLNKSNDKVNQTFLYFMSLVILWMILSMCNAYSDSSFAGLALKTVYWLSMMNLSVLFLLFSYKLIEKKLDIFFYIMVGINTLTIFIRYLFPMDYSEPTFWRLSLPIVAPLMSATFTIPAVYALFLVVKKYLSSKDQRQKAQLKYTFWGMGFAGLLSVISEYVLPAVFQIHIGPGLMYVAILIFVVFIFISIMKYKFLNMRSEYIYRKLLISSPEAIILINKNRRIICINDAAKRLLRNDDIEMGDMVACYIPAYNFDINYSQHEAAFSAEEGEIQLSITQYPIDPEDRNSVKIMRLVDVTSLKKEKELLLKKSITDSLTGFYTKQYCIECYENNTHNPGNEFSLLFIDIDDFKSINDSYGHIAGDKILKLLAQCIKESIPRDSKIFRFGGDEFIILLENTSIDDAYRFAEDIRIRVNNMDISHYAKNQRLTLSIGIANSLILGTNSIIRIIKKADAAMYHSKGAGKNKVTIFTGETDIARR